MKLAFEEGVDPQCEVAYSRVCMNRPTKRNEMLTKPWYIVVLLASNIYDLHSWVISYVA